jgi:hypothetical protein
MTDTREEYAERLRANRQEKDDFFAQHRQSPIPPEERDDFDGLDYFAPDEAYRVEATVALHDDPETVEMETTDGPSVDYERVATFSFEIDGESLTLHGYRQAGEDTETVFIPFRDKTTGQQTYKRGRYLEVEPDRPLEDGETVPIDFNLAYSPFCAYSETFACPLPPEENWLETTIEAGEKDY